MGFRASEHWEFGLWGFRASQHWEFGLWGFRASEQSVCGGELGLGALARPG